MLLCGGPGRGGKTAQAVGSGEVGSRFLFLKVASAGAFFEGRLLFVPWFRLYTTLGKGGDYIFHSLLFLFCIGKRGEGSFCLLAGFLVFMEREREKERRGVRYRTWRNRRIEPSFFTQKELVPSRAKPIKVARNQVLSSHIRIIIVSNRTRSRGESRLPSGAKGKPKSKEKKKKSEAGRVAACSQASWGSTGAVGSRVSLA